MADIDNIPVSNELHVTKPIDSKLFQPKAAGSVIAGSAEAIFEAAACLMLEIREWEIERAIECSIKSTSEEEQIKIDEKVLEKMMAKIVDNRALKISEKHPNLDDETQKTLQEELEELQKKALKMTKAYLAKTRKITFRALGAFEKGDFSKLRKKMGEEGQETSKKMRTAFRNLETKAFFRQHPALADSLLQREYENSLLPAPAGRTIVDAARDAAAREAYSKAVLEVARDVRSEVKAANLDFSETDDFKTMKAALRARLELRINHQLFQIAGANKPLAASNIPSAPLAPRPAPSAPPHPSVSPNVKLSPDGLPIAEPVDYSDLPMASAEVINNTPLPAGAYAPKPTGSVTRPDDNDMQQWVYASDVEQESINAGVDITEADSDELINESNGVYSILQTAQEGYVSAGDTLAQGINGAVLAFYEEPLITEAAEAELRQHKTPTPSPNNTRKTAPT